VSNATARAQPCRNALVLRRAQDEGEWSGGSVEILILSLSKDEDFGPAA
jgi:hypothetical protein